MSNGQYSNTHPMCTIADDQIRTSDELCVDVDDEVEARISETNAREALISR